jgi:DedD protein
MATTRAKSGKRGARGWIGVVLVLLVLIVAGFGFGLVAGVVWEEPQLAVAYLSGETEDVAWNSPSTKTAPDVAAPAMAEPPVPLVPPAANDVADPQVRRERAAEPVAAAAHPPEKMGEFSVQVGAFASSQAAEGLANDLRAKGFDVYVSPGTKAGESRWRVRVGPVATRVEAEGAANRLKQVEKLPTWILSEDSG